MANTGEKNSVQNRSSRYTSGGVTEVNSSALEWWDRAILTTNPDDTSYVVEKRFAGRLDLITALFLGEPRWWWVVAMYNNILDPSAEIREGVILYIPSIPVVKELLTGKLGGIPSQREVPVSILPIV